MTALRPGRLAVITGAGSGIGREIAIILAREGMRLALLDLDSDRLAETAGLLPDGGRGIVARPRVADVTSQQTVTAAADDIVGWGGVPAVLVNSAGILGPFDKRAWELSADD